MNSISWPKINIDELDFSEFAAKFAPVMVPISPMTVAIIGLAEGLQGNGWAYVPAISSGAGMELVGMLSAHLLTEAILKRHKGRIVSSSILLAMYAAFAVWAIYHTANPGMYAAFVLMSIVGYLGGAMFKYNRQSEKEAQLAKDSKKRDEYEQLQKERAELEIEKERAELARQLAEQQERAERARLEHQERMEELRVKALRAEANKAKAEHAETVRRRTTRTDEQATNKLDPARLASVRAYIKGKKSAGEKYTIREVAKACGIPSSSTASDYIKAVQ